MDRQKRKNKSPVVVTCRRSLACLSLVCAFQLLPQTVLADDPAAQVNPADSAAQIDLADSAARTDPADPAAQVNSADPAVQADPAEAAVQNNAADPAEASEGLPAELKEEAPESVPSDDAASFEGEAAQDRVPEAPVGENPQDSVPEATGNDANAVSPEVTENDVNANAASPDDAVSGDDRMTDDADPEETKAPTLVQQPEGDSPTAAVSRGAPVGLLQRQRRRSHPFSPKWILPMRRPVLTSPSGTSPGMSHSP